MKYQHNKWSEAEKIKWIINLIEDNEFIGADMFTQSQISNKIDVMIIIEMGKKYNKFNPYNLRGFKLFSLLRPNRKGGGIGIYARNNLNVHIVYSELTDDFEILHLEIVKDNNKPRNIIGIYRPP